MRRVLEKMAKQLNDYDEASLMQLWQHYAQRVHDFEPTRRWEEAAIALCLIQAVHWKNQLFNYHLASTATPVDKDSLPPLPDYFTAHRAKVEAETEPGDGEGDGHKATILPFPGKNRTDGPPSGASEDSRNASRQPGEEGSDSKPLKKRDSDE